MSDVPQTPSPRRDAEPPAGDPPSRQEPMKAEPPIQDPFTEQKTHPAGEGQGANRPQAPLTSAPRDDSAEATPLERGFSPIP